MRLYRAGLLELSGALTELRAEAARGVQQGPDGC
jgi:hypothetical protein